MMNVERQHSPADGPRRRSYRPEGLPGVSAAAIFFVLIYWLLFAFWLQDIDLNQPPAWWLSQTQTFPLLRAVPIPFVTFFTRAFSWRVLRHILIPGILGWWLANEATTGFLRSFYNFPTRAEAASFLSRLQASVQSVSAEPAATAPPSSGTSRTKLRPASVLTLITLPFMAVFLLLLLYSFIAPPSPLRRTVYTVLIVALGLIWAIVVVLYGYRYFASSSPTYGLRLDRNTLREMRQRHAVLRVGGPGSVVVGNSDVAVTEYNGRFHRVLGPGAQRLLPFEYVHFVLDLRPQDRQQDITGITQDGVEVTTKVHLTFRISSDDTYFSSTDALNQVSQEEPQRPTPDRPYPFGEKAVRAAAYMEMVDDDGRVSSWTALPLVVATNQFRRVLGQNRLDALFDPQATGPAPHPELWQRVEADTRRVLRKYGIQLTTLSMGPLQAPEVVTAQNLSGWRSFWDRENRPQAGGGPEAVATEEEARIEAEVDILRAIVDGLQQARRESRASLAREIVALRLVEALERMAHTRQGDVDATDEDVLAQLQLIRRQLAPPAGDPGADLGV